MVEGDALDGSSTARTYRRPGEPGPASSVRTTQRWLAEKKWTDKPARFDVISITVRETEKGGVDIEHLADAFEATG